jgi:hypothetical protein
MISIGTVNRTNLFLRCALTIFLGFFLFANILTASSERPYAPNLSLS